MSCNEISGMDAKISEIFTKSVKCWLFFEKMWFSQNHAGMDFYSKDEVKKLKVVLVLLLYGI